MNTPELYAVLKNCFSPEEIQNIVPSGESKDPYENAVEAIITEDEAGVTLINRLYRWSENHREKIRAMNASDLKNGMAFEFLEPGKAMGLVIWALYNDDRIVARNLAYKLANRSLQEQAMMSEEVEKLLAEGDKDYDPLADFLDDDSFEEGLSGFIKSIEGEEDDDLEMYSEEDIDELLDSDENAKNVDTENEADLEEDFEEEPIEISEDEVNNIIETLSDETNQAETDQSEPQPNHDELVQKMLQKESAASKLSNQEIDTDELDIEFPVNFEFEDDEELDDEIENVDELIADLSDEDDFNQLNQEQKEEELPTVTEFAEAEQPKDSIQIGGIDISVQSLKTACEKVFQEPVELVTDKNLTEQDKIVVIGQQCGVRVLNGPRYQVQPTKGLPAHENEPVSISSESIQLALSRIFHEEIEIVPDEALLQQGIAVFTGRKTGLEISHQPRAQIRLPEWVNPQDLHPEHNAHQNSESVEELKGQIQQLNERIDALEKAASTPDAQQSIPVIQEEDLSESSEQITPEDIAETPQQESEPLAQQEPEQTKEVEVDTDNEEIDLMSTISGEEKQEDKSIPSAQEEIKEKEQVGEEPVNNETVELDEFDDLNLDELDELDFSELEDETIEQDKQDVESSEPSAEQSKETPAKTQSEETLDITEEDFDLGDLEDLDLDLDLDDSDLSEELNLETEGIDDLDLDLTDIEQWNQDVGENKQKEVDKPSEGESEKSAEQGSIEEELDLELDLGDLEIEEEDQKHVYSGERILLLGGEAKNHSEYERIISGLGAISEFYPHLSDYEEDEIIELVEGADLILTLSDEAVSDPGILTATNYANEHNKRVFQHHSASPGSVKKKLVQLVEEGKV